VPDKKLVAPWGTMERYRQIEWLTFIGTEIHKSFSPLFAPGTPEETQTAARARILSRLEWVNQQLEGKQYLMGDAFCVADAYLFTVTNWSKFVNLDISSLAHLGAFMGRVAARPAVQEALKAEGLIK
jgi:glutathione S-transferase